MTDLILPRRKFLAGLVGLVAAPAVVKAANLMPVKVIKPTYQYTEISSGFIIKRSTINLAELRELLMPELRGLVDDMYKERPEWKSLFLEK